MGPILVFDKSFLQSLSPDEAVWLDHFFICNICPLFYVETLADLEKSINKGRPPEQIVGEIAFKFPEIHGMPSAYHLDLCIGNLLGNPVPMTGQIPIQWGRPVKVAGKSGIVVEPTPEAEAFSRWQKGEFLSVERSFARMWRYQLKNIELSKSFELLDEIGFDCTNCKNLENVKLRAEAFFASVDNLDQQLKLTLALLNVPPRLHSKILLRWKDSGNIPLSDYAPYAAFLMTVELFFIIAMKVGLISSSRASNKIDISYLYYLPFSMVFVSSDRLHRRCIPFFLRDNQDFVWGPDLKADLGRINKFYSTLPEGTKEKGIMSFASSPPQDGEFLVTWLWDRHLKRTDKPNKEEEPIQRSDQIALIQEIKQFAYSPSITPEQIDFDLSNPDSLVIKRLVQKRRGAWYQLPKDLNNTKNK